MPSPWRCCSLVQLVLMARFLKRPRELAPWYNATGVTPVRDRHAGQRVRLALHPRLAVMTVRPLGWAGIVRLGLVQTALGAIVVLTTSTLNRVMVVELALPAMLPGCWSRCTTPCRCSGRAWATAPMWAAGARRGSSAAWRCSRLGGVGAAVGDRMDGHPSSRWNRAGRGRVRADRRRRRRGRNLAAGAAGQARRRATPRGRGDHRVGHDDRRDSSSPRRSPVICSIHSPRHAWLR